MFKKILINLFVICIGIIQLNAQNITHKVEQTTYIIANSDYVSMGEGSTEVINVVNNDFGFVSGVKEVVVSEQPKNGTTTIENFKVLYTPKIGFIGNDKFKYKVCNNNDECDEAYVTIEVKDVDFKPITNKDDFKINYGEDLLADILANDEGIYDVPISVEILNEFKSGFSTLDSENLLNITFNRGFKGKDSLQYEVCDADGDCNQTWVFVQIISDEDDLIIIPEGISPNGDGLNDFFYISDFEGIPLEIAIFDVYGNTIYKSLDYKNNWDGRANVAGRNGEKLKVGNYYYILKVKQTQQEYTGIIYINY